MSGEGGPALSELQAAVRKFLARDERAVDLGRYRAIIDAFKAEVDTNPPLSQGWRVSNETEGATADE